jgi:endoglucanase
MLLRPPRFRTANAIASIAFAIIYLFSLAPCMAADDKPSAEPFRNDPYFKQMEDRLGRGINLGNALEAPHEGDWGVTLKADYFSKIKAAGFQNVRIPVRWSAHAAREAPFTIEPKFLGGPRGAAEPARARAQHAPLRRDLQGP